MSPAPLDARHGVVTAFDDERGWGTVTTAGGEELFLHCTAIADGTRTIAVEGGDDAVPGVERRRGHRQ